MARGAVSGQHAGDDLIVCRRCGCRCAWQQCTEQGWRNHRAGNRRWIRLPSQCKSLALGMVQTRSGGVGNGTIEIEILGKKYPGNRHHADSPFDTKTRETERCQRSKQLELAVTAFAARSATTVTGSRCAQVVSIAIANNVVAPVAISLRQLQLIKRIAARCHCEDSEMTMVFRIHQIPRKRGFCRHLWFKPVLVAVSR